MMILLSRGGADAPLGVPLLGVRVNLPGFLTPPTGATGALLAAALG